MHIIGIHTKMRFKARFWAFGDWVDGDMGTLQVDGLTWWTQSPVPAWLLKDEMSLVQGQLYTSTFTTTAEFTLQFEIHPNSRQSSEASIMHFTDSGDATESASTRIPYIYQISGRSTFDMGVKMGKVGSYNHGGCEATALTLNSWSTVVIELRGTTLRVLVNNVVKCTVSDYLSKLQGRVGNVQLYMGDPWRPVADAKVRHVKYCSPSCTRGPGNEPSLIIPPGPAMGMTPEF